MTPLDETSLRNHYALRAAVATAWVIVALTAGRAVSIIGGALLVAWPAWEAMADLFDTSESNGLSTGPAQFACFVIAGFAATFVALFMNDIETVFLVFFLYSAICGVIRLSAVIGRYRENKEKHGIVLYSLQCVLVDLLLLRPPPTSAAACLFHVAVYVGCKGFCFLIPAAWLTFRSSASQAGIIPRTWYRG